MAATIEAPEKLVGKPIRRREDPKLMTGGGNFLDDIRLPGMSYAAILRSPVAHAKIRGIDTSRAKSMPGVIGVFTGEDLAEVNPLPCAWQAAGVDNNVATPRLLALGEVRQVGDPVAVVVAESVYQANDALEAIEVDFDELPAVVDSREAVKPGAPQLHENAPNNIVMHWTCGTDAETVDRALAEAEVRVSESLYQPATDPDRDGTAWLDRILRPGDRRVHHVGYLPGAARHEAAGGRFHTWRSRAEGAVYLA